MSGKEKAEVDQEVITELEIKAIENMNREEADPNLEAEKKKSIEMLEKNINHTTQPPNMIERMTILSKINHDKTMMAN